MLQLVAVNPFSQDRQGRVPGIDTGVASQTHKCSLLPVRWNLWIEQRLHTREDPARHVHVGQQASLVSIGRMYFALAFLNQYLQILLDERIAFGGEARLQNLDGFRYISPAQCRQLWAWRGHLLIQARHSELSSILRLIASHNLEKDFCILVALRHPVWRTVLREDGESYSKGEKESKTHLISA